MDTEKCRALLCVLQTGSLSGAAERLGYTPSGVSRMMGALEEETGFALLTRSRAGVAPTPECETLLPILRELVHWDEQYAQGAARLRGLETGDVSVGTSYSVYYPWLTQLIAGFCAAHPNIRIHILEGTSSELSLAMRERRVEFCIISRREGDFEWTPLRRDEMVAWVPATHPLGEAPAFPLERFALDPFIELYPGQETDNSRIFQKNRIRPNTRFSTSDSYAAYSMVEAGLGVSMVNALYAGGWNGSVKTLPLSPAQSVDIGVAALRENTLSPAARGFVEYARAHISNL